MMYSYPLAIEERPGFLETGSADGAVFIAAGLLLLVAFLLTVGGILLERKYNGPYALISIPKGEKWKRAAIVSWLQTSMLLPFWGIFIFGNDVSTNVQKILFFAMCSGVWLLFSAVMTLSKIWQWNILLGNYKSMDKSLKNGTFQKQYGIYLFRWVRLFLGAEMKRFTIEGYPEDLPKG